MIQKVIKHKIKGNQMQIQIYERNYRPMVKGPQEKELEQHHPVVEEPFQDVLTSSSNGLLLQRGKPKDQTENQQVQPRKNKTNNKLKT